MQKAALRKFLISLPGVTEGTHADLPTFLVAGRRFATLGWPVPGKITVILDHDDAELMLAASDALERAPGNWGTRGHCHLDFANADAGTARSILTAAWRRVAPARLVKELKT